MSLNDLLASLPDPPVDDPVYVPPSSNTGHNDEHTLPQGSENDGRCTPVRSNPVDGDGGDCDAGSDVASGTDANVGAGAGAGAGAGGAGAGAGTGSDAGAGAGAGGGAGSNPGTGDGSNGGGTRTRAQAMTDAAERAWKDVVGMDTIRQAFQELVVLPVLFPAVFQGTLYRPPTAILLFGPPGCGMTVSVKALCQQCDAKLITASGYVLNAEPIERITALYEQASNAEGAPLVVVCVDCVEVMQNRDAVATLAILSRQADSAHQRGRGPKIVTIGLTTRPWDVHHHVRRQFRRRFYAKLPTTEEKTEVMQRSFAKVSTSGGINRAVLSKLASRLTRATYSDMDCVCRDAHMDAIRVLTSSKYFVLDNEGLYLVLGSEKPCPMCPDEPTPYDGGDDGGDGGNDVAQCPICNALCMHWTDVPPKCVRPPTLSLESIERAVAKMKPSVTDEYIERLNRWAAEFTSSSQ